MTNSYNQEDIQEILQRAMARGDSFSQEQLAQMAAELGISADALQEAQQQWLEERQAKRDRKAFNTHRRRQFHKHLLTYLAVNTFLIIVDLISDRRLDWAYWSILGWGLGLAFQAWNTYQISGEDDEKVFRQWRNAQNR